MTKIQKHIQIVRSSTPSLNSLGTKSSIMIQTLLEKHYEKVGFTIINNQSDLQILISKQPDLVFLAVKQVPSYLPKDLSLGAKIWVSEFLDENNINYTGSCGSAIQLDFDKPSAKNTVRGSNLMTSSYFMASLGQYTNASDVPLDYPLFVKPNNGGGGKGVGADSVVRNFSEFTQKVESISINYGSDSLVETYLPGREFSVAILEIAGSNELLAMPVELITEKNARGDRILGQQIKKDDTEHVIFVENSNLKDAIVNLAKHAFISLGARDYGRIDIRLDEQGTPHFLEANLIPGLSQHNYNSYFTSAYQLNQMMNYDSMILHIVDLGFSREIGIMKNDERTVVRYDGSKQMEITN